LGNILVGEDVFKVGDGCMSCTKEPTNKSNHQRKITVHDSQGFLDTKIYYDLLMKTDKLSRIDIIAKHIRDFWSTVAEISVHCILLVNSTGTRMGEFDFRLAEFLCTSIFEQSIKDRILLVNTKTQNPKLLEKDENEFKTWLEEERVHSCACEKIKISFTREGIRKGQPPKFAGDYEWNPEILNGFDHYISSCGEFALWCNGNQWWIGNKEDKGTDRGYAFLSEFFAYPVNQDGWEIAPGQDIPGVGKIEVKCANEKHGTITAFGQLFNLIDNNPERLIFVDNSDTSKEKNDEKKRKKIIRNIEMATKVVGSIHKFNINSDPIKLSEILTNAIKRSKAIEAEISEVKKKMKSAPKEKKKEMKQEIKGLEEDKKRNDTIVKQQSKVVAEEAVTCCKLM